MKRRNKWEIILDILKLIQEKKKVNKTRIMQGTYLDGRAFQRYFNYLLDEGLVAKSNNDFEFYELTAEGRVVLDKLKEVNKMIYPSLQ
ncbi:Winged helix-turn-helix [uncultured archaeon]|nr:Winged helix-turn-helix [uncultured archaeon]